MLVNKYEFLSHLFIWMSSVRYIYNIYSVLYHVRQY